MKGKLYIKTHGCQMNEYDSAKMADVLAASHGLEITDREDEADVILINTCSIRDKAQEKVFSQLGRWKKLKQQNPNVVIGVGGCVASQEGEGIIQRAPIVDIVFGPQTLHRLPTMLDSVRETGKASIDISFPEVEKFDRQITIVTELKALESGEMAQVKTLYIGLGQGYFVDENAKYAGIVRPSAEGWTEEIRNDLAPRIRDAVKIYEGEKLAEFVPLPVEIN